MSGETYSQRYPGGFVDLPSQTTAIDSQFLNAVERALGMLLGEDPADGEVGVWVASSGRLVYQKITNAQIDPAAQIPRSKLDFGAGLTNADIAPGAAIAYSKLNLLGSIVNGDIATAAAIAISKLAGFPSDIGQALRGDGSWGKIGNAQITDGSIEGRALNVHVGTTPPGSPVTGDTWVYVDSTTAPTIVWQFVYDGAITDANKWVYAGGAPAVVTSPATNYGQTPGATYVNLTNRVNFTVPRAGIYAYKLAVDALPAAGQVLLVAGKEGATAATDARSTNPRLVTANAGVGTVRFLRTGSLAAADQIEAQMRTVAAGIACTVGWVDLEVVPVRVA